MGRTIVFAVLTLALFGCGPGGNPRSGVIPQADTPPDPPPPASAQSSSTSAPASNSARG